MAEELTKDLAVVEATKMDTAASDSCTRSGTFALLLSLALVSLIPYWLEEPQEIALSRYFTLRLSLAALIDQLNDEAQWQQYKASHEEAESMSIEQLLKVRVETPVIEAKTKQVQPIPATTVEDETQQDTTLVLSPPINFRIITGIDAIHQIASFLSALEDSELLTNSRMASGFYDYSIFRWALKRSSLIKP